MLLVALGYSYYYGMPMGLGEVNPVRAPGTFKLPLSATELAASDRFCTCARYHPVMGVSRRLRTLGLL